MIYSPQVEKKKGKKNKQEKHIQIFFVLKLQESVFNFIKLAVADQQEMTFFFRHQTQHISPNVPGLHWVVLFH